jgi:hypothetical protein
MQGERLMPDPEVEAEFERTGEGETRKQTAFRWLGDEAEVQRLREEREHHYLRWAVLTLIGAVIVGFIAMGLTFLPLVPSYLQGACA